MENVRLERAPFFPFSDPIIHLPFYWKSLAGSDRIGKTSDPVRSAAYYPEWKLAFTVKLV
jgi:hypothetical protein